MSVVSRSETLTLTGPAGALAALIETPARDTQEVAHFGVICHPHPLHGGTMDNKVVYTLARAFQERGVPTIRFNFRGVGGSAGRYDEGRGETQDALAVIRHGRQRWPGAGLWLGGFSFGGAVAIRAASTADATRLVSVAPAVAYAADPGIGLPRCPWLIVQGTEDDVVDPRAVAGFIAGVSPAPQLTMLQGAGHFFHGRLLELRDAVLQFLAQEQPLAPHVP